MSEEVKKEEKFVVKVSCELEEDILETITNQIYERLIEKLGVNPNEIIDMIHKLDIELAMLKDIIK